MSASIGLVVASDELRAILVRDGTVCWAARSGRVLDSALSAQIKDLLAQAPVDRWRRPRVTGAVGPSASQVKRLQGLPPVEDPAALALIVSEGAGRFFLRNGIPLDTGGVRIVESGTAWAAAYERPMIAEIAAGCRAAGFRLRAVVPSVVALAAVATTESGSWDDGDVRVEFSAAAGTLASVRRVAADAPVMPLAAAPPALASLGADGWRFSDAYGAVTIASSEPLALRPAGSVNAPSSRRDVARAGIACAIAALLAAAAPGFGAQIDRARASRDLALLSATARDAAGADEELRRMSRALAESDAFAASRRSPTELLGGLALALPAGAALVLLRVDSAGGTLVMLAPHAARAIAALDSVPGITAPEIVGPVTRETIANRAVERVTVHFRLSTPVAK
jgi:hypothetical protein